MNTDKRNKSSFKNYETKATLISSICISMNVIVKRFKKKMQ